MPLDDGYRRQVTLLIKIVTLVAVETCFALKGGTAINLFLRDMPRLSVDLDLTYVPVADRASSLKNARIASGRWKMRNVRAAPNARPTETTASRYPEARRSLGRASQLTTKLAVILTS